MILRSMFIQVHSTYNIGLYEFYRHPTRHLYILARDLISDFEKETKIITRILTSFAGIELEGLMYRSTMFSDLAQPFVEANHVTTTVGTGLVHLSYAHGLDDFKVNIVFSYF